MNVSLSSSLPFFRTNVEGALAGASGFPLAANATTQELVTLVDALALKILPKGYWPFKWTLNAINIATFLGVTVALRAYRSRKKPVPFWLFKLEQRPYQVKRVSAIPAAITSKSHAGAAVVQPRAWQVRWWKVTSDRSGAASSISGEKDAESVHSRSTAGHAEEEVRMGWFFTASCVNCHLVMTGAYVVLLFVQVAQSWVVRGGTVGPPLLDPGALDCFEICALFSTAYFAAIGYIALLLPNVPPWLWNVTAIGMYFNVVFIGLISLAEVALSGSKINNYRSYMHLARVSLPSLGDAISKNTPAIEAGTKLVLFELAKEAHRESLNYRKWQQIALGLVAYGGFVLAIVYLAILVTLSRRVANELAQLRNSTIPPSEDGGPAPRCLGTTSAWSHLDPNFPAPLFNAAQLGFPVRQLTRLPPAIPAPSGPLPLPPAEASKTSSTSSVPNTAGRVIYNPYVQVSTEPSVRSAIPFTSDAAVAGSYNIKSHRRPSSMLSIGSARSTSIVAHDDWLARSPSQGHFERPVSPTGSIDDSGLDLGPRLRLDSEANPWFLDTLHEDIATNEGYIAVCRFLFNCIIDHAAIMGQCFAFGVHSAYLLVVFTKEYPNDAQTASSKVGMAGMIASCLFTVLYTLNCLNLFAPFLLFPTSQVKLASMLASLTSSDSASDHERGLRTRKRNTQKTPSPQAQVDRSAEEQGEVWGLKHQESYASLVASAGKVTSEYYTSAAHSKSGSIASVKAYRGVGISLRDRALQKGYRDLSGTGVVSDDHFAVSRYPPNLSKSTPGSPLPNQKRQRTASSSGHGRSKGKITAHVSKLFRTSSHAEADDDTLARPSHGWVQYGAGPPPSSAHTSFGSHAEALSNFAAPGTPKSIPWPQLPLRPRIYLRKEEEGISGGNKHTAPSLCSTFSLSTSEKAPQQRKPTRGAQMVLDSLISSHALPIQGFYCQTSALGDSSSTLQLYRSPVEAEAGMAVPMVQGLAPPPRRSKRQQREELAQQSQQPPQPPSKHSQQHKHKLESFEVTEQLKSPIETDFDASMGEASNRRRQKLRQQFRNQLEQRRLSEQLSAPTTRPARRDTCSLVLDDAGSPTDTHFDAPDIVAHPPPPLRIRPSEDSEDRHDTMISLPAGFCAPNGEESFESDVNDEEEDRRSIVSDTFGGV